MTTFLAEQCWRVLRMGPYETAAVLARVGSIDADTLAAALTTTADNDPGIVTAISRFINGTSSTRHGTGRVPVGVKLDSPSTLVLAAQRARKLAAPHLDGYTYRTRVDGPEVVTVTDAAPGTWHLTNPLYPHPHPMDALAASADEAAVADALDQIRVFGRYGPAEPQPFPVRPHFTRAA
jgi:hypothetical protein